VVQALPPSVGSALRARQNLEPVERARPFDTEAALREALGAYYNPAMAGWSRALVRPIAAEAFVRSMRTQCGSYLLWRSGQPCRRRAKGRPA